MVLSLNGMRGATMIDAGKPSARGLTLTSRANTT